MCPANRFKWNGKANKLSEFVQIPRRLTSVCPAGVTWGLREWPALLSSHPSFSSGEDVISKRGGRVQPCEGGASAVVTGGPSLKKNNLVMVWHPDPFHFSRYLFVQFNLMLLSSSDTSAARRPVFSPSSGADKLQHRRNGCTRAWVRVRVQHRRVCTRRDLCSLPRLVGPLLNEFWVSVDSQDGETWEGLCGCRRRQEMPGQPCR